MAYGSPELTGVGREGGKKGGCTERLREQGEEVGQETQSTLLRLPRLPVGAPVCDFRFLGLGGR